MVGYLLVGWEGQEDPTSFGLAGKEAGGEGFRPVLPGNKTTSAVETLASSSGEPTIKSLSPMTFRKLCPAPPQTFFPFRERFPRLLPVLACLAMVSLPSHAENSARAPSADRKKNPSPAPGGWNLVWKELESLRQQKPAVPDEALQPGPPVQKGDTILFRFASEPGVKAVYLAGN
ncbi:MAG: hypothetical protein EBZ83_01230, partial [Verrucomicrobia bacterium]|nr:hypothetical protein [Verrucomicrobiota bacterium]